MSPGIVGKWRSDLYPPWGRVNSLKELTFHAKMGSIKDRNGMDLTEAEDIKKRWQEYTEEYTKKIFMTQIIMRV